MIQSSRPIKTLVLDLAGVIYHWSPNETPNVSPRILKKLINTKFWHEYECGSITKTECLEALGLHFDLAPRSIATALDEAAKSVRIDQDLTQEIRLIRKDRPELQIVAMSNISSHDFEYLKNDHQIDEHFDSCFISGSFGMRKPDLRFFAQVLQKIGHKSNEILFVDDRQENIDSARSIGLNVIHHVSVTETTRQLRNFLQNQAQRASQYMLDNAKSLITTTSDDSYSFLANWDQLLILELMRNEHLVQLDRPNKTWSYISFDVQRFKDSKAGRKPLDRETFMSITSGFTWPDDVDTTSVAVSLIKPDVKVLHSVLDDIAANTSPDGRVMVYFDSLRPRLCPAVAANVLVPFAQNNRLHDVLPTLAWVHQSLYHRAYVDGTYYYPHGELFLFNVARLLHLAPPTTNSLEKYKDLALLLRDRLLERHGRSGDALSYALRVVASQWMSIECKSDYEELLRCQELDGGWPAGALYRLPSSGITAGTRGLTTAMALYAMNHHHGIDTGPGDRELTHGYL